MRAPSISDLRMVFLSSGATQESTGWRDLRWTTLQSCNMAKNTIGQ